MNITLFVRLLFIVILLVVINRLLNKYERALIRLEVIRREMSFTYANAFPYEGED